MIDPTQIVTRYAKSGQLNIAYQLFGAGSVNMVLIPGWASHVENIWTLPQFADFADKLAQFASVVILDRRGTGMSDPVVDPPTLEERMDMLREITKGIANVRIDTFDGLLIHYCEKIGARVIVRGLRAASDFEYELQTAHANADMSPQIDTVFLPTRTKYTFISASLIREIASHGGDVSHFAPAVVCEALKAKFGGRGPSE